jgi:hypothetical protein
VLFDGGQHGGFVELEVGVRSTPMNFRPCSCALMPYITKPGSGARMEPPGTSQAMASSEISSSEPLPSMRSKPSGICA